MLETAVLKSLFSYNDHANDLILQSVGSLDDSLLDHPFPIGRGTLRRNLFHIVEGERVWLARWRGEIETRWLSEKEQVSVPELVRRLATVREQRDALLQSLPASALDERLQYRDSLGGLFVGTMRDMILQKFVHSTHHRAQTVNILRQLGAGAPEVDYMMWVRTPG